MTLREKIPAAAFDALSDFAAEVRDAIGGETPAAQESDCGHDHPDAPAVAARMWRGTFASDVKVGDLIAVDGRYFKSEPGRRALRITDRREGELAPCWGCGEAKIDPATFGEDDELLCGGCVIEREALGAKARAEWQRRRWADAT